MPVLRASGLGKSFSGPSGTQEVLRDLDFEIAAGEFCVVTGPSGSGKTTFLNLVSLLDSPSAGELFFEEQNVGNAGDRDLDRLRAERIGMVFQHHGLLPGRSALENILFRTRYLKDGTTDWELNARSLLDEFDLTSMAAKPARVLSGGEAQRISVARALLNTPALICADEPTGNLDEDSGKKVMDALATAAANGVAVLLVTHNPSWLTYATTHYHCRDRKLVRDGDG